MMHISLFSGIGGFELAAEWLGWRNIVSCEINEFGHNVLKHYWPHAYHHDDIYTLTHEVIDEQLTKRFGTDWRTDDIILTGGFPCQPYSAAGKRQGKDDDRHLWPQMLRVIQEVRPKWVVGENVLGLVNWNGGLVFDEVQADLEAEGYEVQPYVLPAAAVNAPHRRDRVWFVAYAKGNGSNRTPNKTSGKAQRQNRQSTKQFKQCSEVWTTPDTESRKSREQTERERGEGAERGSTDNGGREAEGGIYKQLDTPDTYITGLQGSKVNGSTRTSRAQPHKQPTRFIQPTWDNFPTQSPVRGRNDGFLGGLDGITVSKWRNESIKAYGNAIVPQVAYQIFKAIQHYEDQQ